MMIGGFVIICATPGTSHRLYEAGGALFITGGEEKKLSKYSLCSDSKVILLKYSLFFSPFIRRCLNHVCSAVVCCVGAGLGLFRAVRPAAQTLSVSPSAA